MNGFFSKLIDPDEILRALLGAVHLRAGLGQNAPADVLAGCAPGLLPTSELLSALRALEVL